MGVIVSRKFSIRSLGAKMDVSQTKTMIYAENPMKYRLSSMI
jgi:hypothetical protein